jgi:hypothetical protein
VSRRTFLLVGLVAALLVAGVVSQYASSRPDGLEHVAEQTGFIDSAEEHGAADSPLADYQASGVEDDWLSGAVAGVAGSLLVLALAGGLFWVVRRRGPVSDQASQPSSQPASPPASHQEG